MNNARDTIMATLAQAGITNLTVDDVIAEFQASDELAGYLAGADDTEQVILASSARVSGSAWFRR